MAAQHANAMIHVKDIRVQKTKNVLRLKIRIVVIYFAPQYQFVCICSANDISISVCVYLGRPKALYTNPCQKGTPLTEEGSGIPIACTIEIDDSGICPNNYACTEILGSIQAVCCPLADEKTTESEKIEDDDLGKVQTSM